VSATKAALSEAASAVMAARGIPLTDVDAFDAIQSGIVGGSIPLPVVESSPRAAHGSDVRVVAVWHYGNDTRTVDVVACDAVDALRGVDPRMPITTISGMLGRPNDAHHALRVDWSWWTICQVWARDTRPAREIVADARRHDRTPPGQEMRAYAYPRSCGYGCGCGAFPLDACYVQDLACDR